jgi:hypothetical protein
VAEVADALCRQLAVKRLNAPAREHLLGDWIGHRASQPRLAGCRLQRFNQT